VTRTKPLCCSLALAALAMACSAGEAEAPQGTPQPAMAYLAMPLETTPTCPYGGVRVDMGIDENANGLLDPAEVDSSQSLCHGSPGPDGAASLVLVDVEPPGARCAAGGIVVYAGLDDDGDGTLALTEVDATEYVCGAAPWEEAVVPAPLALVNGVAHVEGTLGTGDLVLSDGSRAELHVIELAEAGVLQAGIGGPAELHVFTDACLAEPRVNEWGPCFVARAPAALAAGRYVLLMKSQAGLMPWDSISYGLDLAFLGGYGIAAGVFDATFGTGGVASTAIADVYSYPRALAVEPDGDVVVAWTNDNGSDTAFRLARYTAAGVLDATFGSGGQVTTDLGTYGSADAIALDGLGRIVVAGVKGTPGQLVVARYDTAGSIDTDFGDAGTASLAVTPYSATPIAVQPDGKIVVATASADHWYPVVVRLGADGSPDATFGGGDGLAELALAQSVEVNGVDVRADGKLLILGARMTSSTSTPTVARLLSNGDLDETFASDGTAELSTDAARSAAMSSDPAGRLLVATIRGGSNHLEVFRVLPDGSVDPTYGGDGSVSMVAPFQQIWRIQMDALEQLVVVGYDENDFGVPESPKVARFLASGALDRAFGTNGALALPAACPELATMPDGRLVCATTPLTGTGFGAIRVK
jgi:uncharacterized delta-60 repeat protein